MDKNKLQHYKELLLEEKEEIIATLNLMEENEPNESLNNYFDELSAYDNHPADTGSETFLMEMNFNLKDHEVRAIQEVNKALERINNGQYGKCISCGKDIEEERLEILPTAIECMDCEKEGLSIEDQIQTRPAEEDVLGHPFGRSFMDTNDDYNGFDGEDSWQAVARFNKTEEKNKALDYYDNNMYDENVSGVVQDVDKYSQGFYVGQLEHENRKDIPRKQNKDKD